MARTMLGAVAVIAACAASPGWGQAPGPSRADQAAAFDRMVAAPDNLDLMFGYAQISIALQDYEAAITTLERMLIYRQDLPRVRLELGVAYFALGSYEVARLYFGQVLADPATPDDVRARVARYTEQIDARTQTSVLRGVASVGLSYASNANLGPDDANVSVGGVNGFALDAANTSQGDVGLRVVLGATHIYDLQRANADTWQTDVSFFGLRYAEQDGGNIAFARARTGPRLGLDRDQFGPKIRPFVEASALYSDDDFLYANYGFGGEYTDTLSPEWAMFAETGFGFRNFFEPQDDEDAFNVRGSVGAAYSPMRDLVLRGTLLGELEEAEAEFNSNIEMGVRLAAEWRYDSTMPWADTKWALSGYAEARGRFFEEPEAVVDPNTHRRDLDLRAGLSHLFAIRDGFGVQLDLDTLLRNSTIDNFDLNNIGASLSLQYKF